MVEGLGGEKVIFIEREREEFRLWWTWVCVEELKV